MCYYNGVKVTKKELIRLLQLEKEINEILNTEMPLQSGFKYLDWPIVKPIDGGKDIELTMAHWELISPSYKTMEDVAKSRKFHNTLNAKGEEVLQKKTYRDAALNRRCLILSSGFYEWRHYTPFGSKKDVAYPYYITLDDRSYFYIAGIWQPWTDQATGLTMDTFSLMTTEANTLMAQVHNTKKRMPTILPEELAYEWIQDGLSETRIRQLATYQIDADEMKAHSVVKDFTNHANPETPFRYAELPELGNDGPLMNVGLFG